MRVRGWMASVMAMAAGCGSAGQVRGYDQMRAELGRAERPPALLGRADVDGAHLFDGRPQLERAELVRAVLARNPELEAARQAWRAALAEVPQATALKDPMLSYTVAPLSIGSGEPRLGQRVDLSQEIPWPGKRRLAGEARLADATAAKAELEAARLELAVMASGLYHDAYVNARALEINRHHVELLEEMKKSATAEYVTGHGSQQDPLAAEVELAHVEHERLELESERDVIRARLNGLLHRAPDAPLPPPPAALADLDEPTPGGDDLVASALRDRPELAAARARIEAGRRERALARREYYPDLQLMGSYDSMWDMPEHRFMVGLGINLPLWRGKRSAAVEAAEARTARARAELDRQADQIRVEVEEARRRLEEERHVLHLYDDRLAPAARDQVKAALAGYSAGRNPFGAALEAEKNLREVELRIEGARAELSRRKATLDRALGRVPGMDQDQGGGR